MQRALLGGKAHSKKQAQIGASRNGCVWAQLLNYVLLANN
jgi:hypothetical protein